MESINEKAILNDIFQSAQIGSKAICDLLPKVENATFRADLKTQDSQYKDIQKDAAGQLMQMGETPQELGTMKKAGMWASVNAQTVINTDTSHLAEVMINGSTMGITNMTKLVNTYQNPNLQVKGLADRLIQMEEQNIQRLKTYLQ